MFPQSLLKEKGAKRAVLEYLASQDSSIPIPEEVPIEEAGVGDILRSDHWREFDDFYGVFESVIIGELFRSPHPILSAVVPDPKAAVDFMFFRETGIKKLDEYSSWRKRFFIEYCHAKGLDPDEVVSELKVFPQRLSNAKVNGTIMMHPNVENRYIIYADDTRRGKGTGAVVDLHKHGLELQCLEHQSGDIKLEMIDEMSAISIDAVKDVVDLYERVTSFPPFQDGFVYMMEFGLDPAALFQVRRFRKKEYSHAECPWNEETSFQTDLVFGITPQEGMILPYYYGGFNIGPQVFDPNWNGEAYQFNGLHKNGFSFFNPDTAHYVKTFLPNAVAGFAGRFCHYFHHGGLANMAEIPIYMFNTKFFMQDNRIETGMSVKIFSNGRRGYVNVM